MYKEHPSLSAAPDHSKIYRYMNFASFYSFLKTGTLFFRVLKKYTDLLEGTISEYTIQEIYEQLRSIDRDISHVEALDRARKEAENISIYSARTLSNSWSLDEGENYALWKIYLQSGSEGFAIQTTVGNLKEQLRRNPDYDFYSGKVSYEHLKYQNVDQFKVSTNKRSPYAYEKEYRALIMNHYDYHAQQPKAIFGESVKINVDELVECIYISPFAGDWFERLGRNLIKESLPNFPDHKIVRSLIKDK